MKKAHCFTLLVGPLLLIAPPSSRGDNFRRVYFDSTTDELVIGIVYRGTNPDHQFTLKWGSCQTRSDNQRQITGELLDQQWQDAARQEYRKTLRFSLADLDCRPAVATVRTAPRFLVTVQIPATSAVPNPP
jgi:hypothetical protein